MTFHETLAILFHETYTYLNLIKHMDISNVQTPQQTRLPSREKQDICTSGLIVFIKRRRSYISSLI